MRGSCLTQNGARFRSQKESERHAGSGGERGRESSTTHRGLIYPLSLSLSRLHFFFSSPPLLSLLFSLHRNCCPFFLYISSLSLLSFLPLPPSLPHPPPSPPLPLSSHPSSGCVFFLDSSVPSSAATAATGTDSWQRRTSRILGGNL